MASSPAASVRVDWVIQVGIIYRQGGRDWKFLETTGYDDEKHLQEILFNRPDLLPVADLNEGSKSIRVVVMEAGLPGSGSSDLIGVDEDGGITIVECKLAKNPESKREVIGQVLEYGAFLWKRTYPDFDSLFLKERNGRNGKPLADLMAAAVDPEEWSEEVFRGSVSANLERGHFHLIVVVDEINDELRRVADYVNNARPTGFTLHALEMRRLAEADFEILIPHMYGSASTRSSTVGKRPRATSDEDFIKAREAEGLGNEARAFLAATEWARKRGHEAESTSSGFRIGPPPGLTWHGRFLIGIWVRGDESTFETRKAYLQKLPEFWLVRVDWTESTPGTGDEKRKICTINPRGASEEDFRNLIEYADPLR
jgi:hypothetical protein